MKIRFQIEELKKDPTNPSIGYVDIYEYVPEEVFEQQWIKILTNTHNVPIPELAMFLSNLNYDPAPLIKRFGIKLPDIDL